MATRVYKEEEITLQDGKDVVLRPLPIGPLRRFMTEWNKITKVKDDDEGYDVFVNCAGIALEKDFKGAFDSLKPSEEQKKQGLALSPEYKEHLENVLDLDTIYKIIEVCGGIKLDMDPKVLQDAAAMMEAVKDAE